MPGWEDSLSDRISRSSDCWCASLDRSKEFSRTSVQAYIRIISCDGRYNYIASRIILLHSGGHILHEIIMNPVGIACESTGASDQQTTSQRSTRRGNKITGNDTKISHPMTHFEGIQKIHYELIVNCAHCMLCCMSGLAGWLSMIKLTWKQFPNNSIKEIASGLSAQVWDR